MPEDAIRAVVTRERGINHADVHYPQGAKMNLSPDQFREWNDLGLVERAPAEKQDEPKEGKPAAKGGKTA